MKRIALILLILLFLCSCKNSHGADSMQTETASKTDGTSYYVADSEIEQQTSGAVLAYQTGELGISWIAPMPGGVLLATVEEQTFLQFLSGTEGTVVASATVPAKLTADAVWQVTASGFVYYDSTSEEIVFLDASLKTVKQISMPEDMTGTPVIAHDGSAVYYCVDQQVNALDTNLNIVRPIRTNTCTNQTLLACYGTVLGCRMQDEQGVWKTIYFSTENGEENSSVNEIYALHIQQDNYFASCADGTVTQYIYAIGGNPAQQLYVPSGTAFSALELGGAIGYQSGQDALQLNFYDLATGKRTASVSTPEVYRPVMVAADSNTGGVWLLNGEGNLSHWLLNNNPVEDEAAYTGQIYTAQAPDTVGLDQCRARAAEMEKAYGVVIRLWERALVSNDGYDIQPEYQTEAINNALSALDAQLSRFPSKFLNKSVAGKIRLCIVRSIGAEVTSAYHWYDGDPFIILSAGVDMEQAFHSAFAYVLDIHVLGNSTIADGWQALNPVGFTYGGETTVMAFLEGDARAFASRTATKSVTDDRASVFLNAMLSDNAEMFQSETMQAKLLLLCQAIRDAWRLKSSTETFPWEQYLNVSLAYQEADS